MLESLTIHLYLTIKSIIYIQLTVLINFGTTKTPSEMNTSIKNITATILLLLRKSLINSDIIKRAITIITSEMVKST